MRFASLSLLLLLPIAVQARELVDGTRTKVALADQPKRIVTLAPSLGELAADLLGDDLSKIIGVSEYTDYPPVLKKVSSVGPYNQVNLEKVVSLKPDLVLATLDGNSKEQVLHLRELGVPVVVVSTETLDQVADSIRLVAQALGLPERGTQMATQFKTGLDHIRERAKSHPKKKVLLQLSESPLIVVGGRAFLHDALRTLGATNVYEDAKAHYPRPSIEDAVHRNPDVVVVLALGGSIKPFQMMAAKWTQFKGVQAVKSKNIYVLQGDSVLRPTLRLLEGLSLLEKTIYGKS